MTLKKEVGANSIGSYMAGIEAFFETNDLELRWKKIRRLYPAKVKKTGGKIWTTDEIQLMLDNTRDYRQKALIHFLAASGLKRCTFCEIYTDWEGIHCPCCGLQLRLKPRSRKNKLLLKLHQQ